MLMDLKSSRLLHVRLACLSSEHETSEGVWDPDRWFASVSSNTYDTNVRGKRKQPVDVVTDTSLRKRPSGKGSKSADTADADDDLTGTAEEQFLQWLSSETVSCRTN